MDTKILVYSDLHLEFSDFAPSSSDFDVVVLAGDIGVGTQGVKWAIRNFEDKPVVCICWQPRILRTRPAWSDAREQGTRRR